MLDRLLEENAKKDTYPFHMPGHKRNPVPMQPGDAFSGASAVDITEIDGFDNLHHAEGILKEAQERAAALYGAKQAWYLVNGSTCGLLAAISAAAPKRSEILTARNCHKAVYHALYLRELIPHYLFPCVTSQGLQGQIDPDRIRRMLAEHPQIKAVVITSPTYDGVLSDIASIADAAHETGLPLIVDQAHGAHFGLGPSTPQNAGALGADLVVVSVHKTLPAFTQTALLLSYSDRVPAERIEEFLDIYETSSPSYILMGGIERCVRIMAEQGRELCTGLSVHLDRFYKETAHLAHIRVLRKADFTPEEAFDFDESKILIFPDPAYMSGPELAKQLRESYHIEPEMVTPTYVLALASVMDTEEGFRRLSEALKGIDGACAEGENKPNDTAKRFSPAAIYVPMKRLLEIHEADHYERIFCSADPEAPDSAVGKTSASYIYLYPPGIPLAVPGEQITEELLETVRAAQAAGLETDGLTGEGKIRCLAE